MRHVYGRCVATRASHFPARTDEFISHCSGEYFYHQKQSAMITRAYGLEGSVPALSTACAERLSRLVPPLQSTSTTRLLIAGDRMQQRQNKR